MTDRIERTIDLAAPVARVWRTLTDHDCGSMLGFLLANVAFALKDGEVAADFKREVRALLDR